MSVHEVGNRDVRHFGAETSLRVKEEDSRGGFDLWLDKTERVIYARLWGIWELPVATKFCKTVLEFGRAFVGRPWSIIADSSKFSVQSPQVSNLRQKTMLKLRELGCDTIASIGSNTMHALQFKRIAGESHLGGAVFGDEKAALDWVHESRKHPDDLRVNHRFPDRNNKK